MANAGDMLERLVRVGEVSSVNAANCTVRVIFRDLDNMVSGDLKILQFPGMRDGDGRTVSSWLPSIGQRVYCLYLPVFNGDGVVLGVLQ